MLISTSSLKPVALVAATRGVGRHAHAGRPAGSALSCDKCLLMSAALTETANEGDNKTETDNIN